MFKHINIKVTGQVQRVMFRISAKDKAERLGLAGLARNLADGSVYIEIEGQENKLKEFISWCYEGPELAKVEKVEVSEGILQNLTEFSVI